jgi:peptidoglycan/LPS O-acetylase OafA/YrhL
LSDLQPNSLELALSERRGCTIILRLIAAVAVLISHTGPLSRNVSGPLIGNSPLGEVAVSLFFVLSGYFVFSSSLKHKFLVFILLRFARLFPALFAANFVLAFVIGPLLSLHADEDVYWASSDGPLKFLLFNSTLLFGLQPGLASVFSDNPYPYVVNGSLWTLPTELKCYILCACIGVVVKLTRHIWPLYVSFVGLSLLYISSIHGSLAIDQVIPNSTLRLIIIFFSGALVTRVKFSGTGMSFTLKIFAILFLFVVWRSPTFAPFFYWSLIPAIALIPTFVSSKFNFFTQRDFSYGFYLWAFPIQQLTMYFCLATTTLSFSILSSLITLGISVASWYLVEFPAMMYARKLLKEV